MKSLITLSVLSTICLIPLAPKSVQADPVGTCSNFFKVFDEIKFQRLAFSPSDCILSASPRAASQTYRSFFASSQGKFMVFESYNGSSSSGATAAKVYHFFPRDRHPTITDQDGVVELLSSNKNISFKFNQTKAILTEMIGGVMEIDHNISPAARGGLVIKEAQALILESGFVQGTDPTSKPKNQSVFRDRQGKKCSVVNTEVFEYFNGGDNMFKFNDQELKKFLKERCPQINPGY